MNLFKLKKFSAQITFIIGITIIIIAGGIAVYMESLLFNEYKKYADLNLQAQISDTQDKCNTAFMEVANKGESFRLFAESYFDLDAYRDNPTGYFDNNVRPVMGNFVYNFIDRTEAITTAYFTVYPGLTDEQVVNELYYDDVDGEIIQPESQSYEEYMDIESEDMLWFYGSFDSGKPRWSEVYEWEDDGTVMVSYTEPVIIDGVTIGIIGFDVLIDHVESLVNDVKLYDTGFALIKSNHDEFFESNEFIQNLSEDDRIHLSEAAQSNDGGTFDITLNNTEYLVTSGTLSNDYVIFLLAPTKEIYAESVSALIGFIVILLLALTAMLAVAYVIGHKMSKPINALSVFMRRVGTTGDVTYTKEEKNELGYYVSKGDEIGQLIQDCDVFISNVKTIADALELIADGDLTVEIDVISEADTISLSLKRMIANLNDMFNEMRRSAAQVSIGANQISDSASALSSGSSEQAASVEELSDSINRIREHTGNNAGVARDASEMSNIIRNNAEKGSVYMKDMTETVKEINDASAQISKVINVIDDIAFQTNILALNAAVEAARAGQHGKGFAVVAEEVRNLATKSAEAAKNTGELIENSVSKANLGMDIASKTAQSLTEIVDGIKENVKVIADIADASSEQLESVNHLNAGLNQVSEVVQQNSAAAQEYAATSEELSAQADMLEKLISRFKVTE